mmetsp:Transcript_9154/g.21708  ORF Transcript_9154/g.21708 Transcript_9154/m.21708 type:complete len:108 (-) Transcript_9154:838-1161(-)
MDALVRTWTRADRIAVQRCAVQRALCCTKIWFEAVHLKVAPSLLSALQQSALVDYLQRWKTYEISSISKGTRPRQSNCFPTLPKYSSKAVRTFWGSILAIAHRIAST